MLTHFRVPIFLPLEPNSVPGNARVHFCRSCIYLPSLTRINWKKVKDTIEFMPSHIVVLLEVLFKLAKFQISFPLAFLQDLLKVMGLVVGYLELLFKLLDCQRLFP